MKIDLHCHSKFSKRPVLWLMQKIGCPESFTEPLELYELMRGAGMLGVTITDHNTIEGALEIADLPGAFVSCEYTTYFPEDNCKIHVTAYNITEAQHCDLNQARENIFDLVALLQEQGIAHACAHPLFSPNNRLSMEHLELLLLLFKNLEWNGDLPVEMNGALRQIVGGLSPAQLERMAEKHGVEPAFPQPWKKNLIAGSDDHSSLNLARAFTEVRNATNFQEFWKGVEQGQAKIRHQAATPQTLARTIYGTAYQFYKEKVGLEKYVNKDLFLHFLEKSLRTRPNKETKKLAWYHSIISMTRRKADPRDAGRVSLLDQARREAENLIRSDPQLMKIVKQGSLQRQVDEKWYEFVNQLSNKILVQFSDRIMHRIARGQWLDMFHSIGSAGALYALLAPYFVSYSLHARLRSFAGEALQYFQAERSPASDNDGPPKVAHFTDTFHELNGVARRLRSKLRLAQEMGKDYTVVTCFKDEPKFERGVQPFRTVGAVDLPEYPEMQLLCPPFLQMLEYCYEEQFSHIHVATPGPVGIAALAIGRILKIPVIGTYHASLPQYANLSTGDSFVENMLWKYVIWFYQALDVVFVPSEACAEEIRQRGVSAGKIRLYPRGVDLDLYNPSRRNGILLERFGWNGADPVFVYSGRLAEGKNLPVLSQAFRNLLRQNVSARLLIAGDGPARSALEKDLADLPVAFAGRLEPEEMARVYASSDALIMPSATDIFGDVILEAQAAGIPVVVTNQGGAAEYVLPDQTGLVVPANDPDALTNALHILATSPQRRKAMGLAARAHMEKQDIRSAFERFWETFTHPAMGSPDPSVQETFFLNNPVAAAMQHAAL